MKKSKVSEATRREKRTDATSASKATMRRLPDDAVRGSVASPVGRLGIVASSQGLHAIVWEESASPGGGAELGALPRDDGHPIVAAAATQLAEYFARRRQRFDLPLSPRGTKFQLRAWRALARIPYGATVSYEQQAARLGDRRWARAVGTANARNPIAIVVPCHRVVAKSGALAGFGGGVDNKRKLLELEKGV
jgi:methylated-DNA-[protein]-cysteine S-methyltransferase